MSDPTDDEPFFPTHVANPNSAAVVVDLDGLRKTAACDVCADLATGLWVGEAAKVVDETSVFDMRVTRREMVVAYACDAHSAQVMDAVLEEYGSAVNNYSPDLLALAVSDARPTA